MKKITVRECITKLSVYEKFNGTTISETIEVFSDINTENYSDVKIRVLTEECKGKCLFVYGTRIETDKEFDKRLKAVNKSKELKTILKKQAVEREIETYLKLKKKYGDKL